MSGQSDSSVVNFTVELIAGVQWWKLWNIGLGLLHKIPSQNWNCLWLINSQQYLKSYQCIIKRGLIQQVSCIVVCTIWLCGSWNLGAHLCFSHVCFGHQKSFCNTTVPVDDKIWESITQMARVSCAGCTRQSTGCSVPSIAVAVDYSTVWGMVRAL